MITRVRAAKRPRNIKKMDSLRSFIAMNVFVNLLSQQKTKVLWDWRFGGQVVKLIAVD
jgi:hypothetical protein